MNAISDYAASRALRACCNASRWIDAMLTHRPYASVAALLHAADAAWEATGPNDWREAIHQHPRIGEQAGDGLDERARAWSAGEQAGVSKADAAARAALQAVNREYEARFGHIFLIHASGKNASEIIAACRARMENSPDEELTVAAEELRKITRRRLEKLITP